MLFNGFAGGHVNPTETCKLAKTSLRTNCCEVRGLVNVVSREYVVSSESNLESDSTDIYSTETRHHSPRILRARNMADELTLTPKKKVILSVPCDDVAMMGR